MSILVLSTYPPERCGIAAYAAQSVQHYRDTGLTVRVLTWGTGAGDFRRAAPPKGWRVLDVRRHLAGFDRVVLQYAPALYVDDRSAATQVLSRLAMWRLFRSVPHLEVVVHEQSWYPPLAEMSRRGRLLWRLERAQWAAAKDLCFHNAAAVAAFRTRFRLPGTNARIVEHGRDFRPHYGGGKADARRELGLSGDAALFVSTGFITPYKGYEVVLDALALAPHAPCEYHIVGSAHPNSGEQDLRYIERLREAAASDPRVRFRLEFISDEEFDRWVRAADALLLPYRSSTSSSVLARGHLLGTPAIVSGAAGLRAELQPTDCAFEDARELAGVLAAWAARTSPGAVAG